MRKRQYDMEDTRLLQFSRTKRQHFINNMAAFTGFDPTFDNTYAANWLGKIEQCETIESDETLNDGLAQCTSEVETAGKTGFDKANDLLYYVLKAFPDDESMLREFGFNRREKVRGRILHTIMWLKIMRLLARDVYAAELAAVNMPPTILTDLEAAENALMAKETAQELYKSHIIRTTRKRIKNFNELYAFFSTASTAAQVVFSDDKENRDLFSLPKPHPGPKPSEG